MGNCELESVMQLISNIPTSIISKQSMHHGVVATALNAIKNKCMFVVFYKPRSSQFLVNFDKFVDGVNKKFSIVSKFSMKFEGKYLNEIRYYGTIVGVRDFSTLLIGRIQNGEV
ncbi:hypothetical protein Bca4012_019873 [Brassica carinata]|uniref:Auxin response factor domain-containing protein n=1 Tax=Brassica carinata TaxID=52824 RepID=A0A8X7WHX8_BRACI|nr:hypothetical protein Bca52824_001721 [Brassica carinata]